MEALCDRICIIREGTIARCVALDELMRLGNGTVEVTARGWSARMLGGIEEYVESKRETGVDAFLVVRERRFLRRVIEHLYAEGAEILEVAGERSSLEDLFMREISRPGPRTEDAEE